MKKDFDASKIATLTGTAIQDDETFKSEGGFVPERDQVYFELEGRNGTFLVGAREILTCLRLLEKIKEVPEISNKWWGAITMLYGQEVYIINYDEKTSETHTVKEAKKIGEKHESN